MTAAFALVIALFMLLVSVTLVGYANYIAKRTVQQELRDRAAEYVQDIGADVHTPADWAAFAREEAGELREDSVALWIRDAHGRVIVRAGEGAPAQGTDNPNDGRWRTHTVTVHDAKIVLGAPWQHTAHELQEFAFATIGISLLVVLVTSSGAWILVGRVLSPIGALAREVATASTDNLRLVLSSPSQDAELVSLVGTLNAVLGRLAETAEAKGRFYAAASHELRTPLQGLSGLLEVGLSRPRTVEEWQSIVQDAHRQSRRLNELTRELLTLHQLELLGAHHATAASAHDSALLSSLSTVDVVEMLTQGLEMLQPTIRLRALTVTDNLDALGEGEGELLAPWSHVEMIVHNLLENAVKYAALGGEVRVNWQPNTLTVENSCAQVPADIERWGEPFYRPDAARNIHTGGNGLGLAICKAVCRVNGWDFRLDAAANGIRAQVTFTAR